MKLLKKLFDDAYLDNTLENGLLTVREIYRIEVYIDEKKGFITFTINIIVKDQSRLSDLVEYAHKVSKNFILIKAFEDGDIISYKTYLWLEGGLTPMNIIKTYKAHLFVAQEAIAIEEAKRVLK